MSDEPAMAIEIEELSRWQDLRTLLGWRWQVTVFAWDKAESRWRPPPTVLNVSLFSWSWQGRVRKLADAEPYGDQLIKQLRAEHKRVVKEKSRIKFVVRD